MVPALMIPLIRQFSFALVVVATLLWWAVGQTPGLEPSGPEPSGPEPSGIEPQHGVLALRSGGVIEGHYSKLGDQYVVAVNGGEIRIDASKVEVACRSIEQAYTIKRAAISQHSVSSHLRLAQWCVRHKLYQQAAAEIDTARQIDDGDRRIALAQRRLHAVQQQQATSSNTASPPVSPPDHVELDRWLDGLPRESVVEFATAIQPLLSNRCATGACHGPTSSRVDVHVLRVPRGRSISRRVTARNLREVMKWIDRDRPHESALLAVPTRPHGSAESAIFAATGDQQYRRLVHWVYGLSQPAAHTAAGRNSEEISRPFADAPVMRSQWGPTSPLLQPTRLPWRNTSRRTPVYQALAERQQALEADTADATAEGFPAGLRGAPDDQSRRTDRPRETADENGRSTQAPIARANRYHPVDEFDPEIFNRRNRPAGDDKP